MLSFKTFTVKAPAFAMFLMAGAALAPNAANAELTRWSGMFEMEKLPKPAKQRNSVQLAVPHIAQTPGQGVPTSVAMVLKYFGENHDAAKLKAMSEEHKLAEDRTATLTRWVDMQYGLTKIGHEWSIRNFPLTDTGFARGMARIKASLKDGLPVLIDVHLGDGHTFVITGYDDRRREIYVADPYVAEGYGRILGYDALKANWHNHRFGKNRSAMFTKRNPKVKATATVALEEVKPTKASVTPMLQVGDEPKRKVAAVEQAQKISAPTEKAVILPVNAPAEIMEGAVAKPLVDQATGGLQFKLRGTLTSLGE